MQKEFPADFYVTCATVIPVLFLAIAVQGRSYENFLTTVLKVEERRRTERWTVRVAMWPVVQSLRFLALAIAASLLFGEGFALAALHYRSDDPFQQGVVVVATGVLLLAVATGPIGAYQNLKEALEEQRSSRRQSASDEAGGSGNQPGEPLQDTGGNGGHPDAD